MSGERKAIIKDSRVTVGLSCLKTSQREPSFGAGCRLRFLAYRDLQRHHRLMRGDILISMTGNVGRVCINTEDDCLLNQRVGKLEPLAVDPDLLFLLMSQRKFLASMAAKAKGGAQGNLSAAIRLNRSGERCLA